MSNHHTVSINFSWGWLLTIAFVLLKLTGKIAWSWWWVLSPLWISASLFFLLLVVIVLISKK